MGAAPLGDGADSPKTQSHIKLDASKLTRSATRRPAGQGGGQARMSQAMSRQAQESAARRQSAPAPTSGQQRPQGEWSPRNAEPSHQPEAPQRQEEPQAVASPEGWASPQPPDAGDAALVTQPYAGGMPDPLQPAPQGSPLKQGPWQAQPPMGFPQQGMPPQSPAPQPQQPMDPQPTWSMASQATAPWLGTPMPEQGPVAETSPDMPQGGFPDGAGQAPTAPEPGVDAMPKPGGGGVVAKLRDFFALRSGYSRHPRNSVIWRWWRPLITSPLAIFYFVVILVLLMVVAMGTGILSLETIQTMSEGAEDMSQSELFFSPFGALLMIGGLASMTFALASALWTSRERPFGTVVSVFGHIRPKTLLRALPFAFVSLLIPMLLEVVLLHGGFGHIRLLEVEPYVLAMLVVLLPLQCVAEEVVFRGYIMQTLASWLPRRLFAVALVGQAALFMLGHAYDLPGQVAILCTGLIYGWLAEKTGGLETGMAFHIANNVLAFALMFTGLSEVSAQVSVAEGVLDTAATVLMPLLFVLLGMRMGWVDDAETIAAGEGECRMFGSQSDALMWERIQAEQLADWNRFMSEMPAVGDGQVPPQGQAQDPGAMFLPGSYVDGEGTIVGVGEDQYDDDQIVSVMDTGSQSPVVPESGAWASQQVGALAQGRWPQGMAPAPAPIPQGSQGTPSAWTQEGQPVAWPSSMEPMPSGAPQGMQAPMPPSGSPVWEGAPQGVQASAWVQPQGHGGQAPAYGDVPAGEWPSDAGMGATGPATPAGDGYAPNAPVPDLGSLL